jgi:hypothetical protein
MIMGPIVLVCLLAGSVRLAFYIFIVAMLTDLYDDPRLADGPVQERRRIRYQLDGQVEDGRPDDLDLSLAVLPDGHPRAGTEPG